MDLEEKCQWKKCRSNSGLVYFDIGLCMFHWVHACDESSGRNVETRRLVYHNVGPKAKKAMREKYAEQLEEKL